ncbi:hypothetical protein PAXRUDRAFT_790514 [Paxillus rubicundulus Ve08.2h10]|uniref:Uncharacterized protein n=1 Tax=Paxillus rubicundulus Ve08.2h10 TaxID=930991 RepID=A0A0D0D7X6_9AGAM|nr:hypothetical protein PAXRUDRAFT_790514 [Paxillus rubicundulus Ve08.2h10]
MRHCQARSQNEETTPPAVPSPGQIQATAPTPGSPADIVFSTPVPHRNATHCATSNTLGLSSSATQDPVGVHGPKQPVVHIQTSVQPPNTSPSRPLSPASVVFPVPGHASTRQGGRARVLKPTTADMMMERRYSRKGQADWRMQYDGAVTPGERDYAEFCPPGWTRLVQAEGASYYYHREHRVFTDADMSTDKTRKAVESSARNLFDRARTDGIQLSEDTELVIELGATKEKERAAFYYFVDRRHRILFWLHEFEYKKLLGHIKGVRNKSHIKYRLETQYWTHCEMNVSSWSSDLLGRPQIAQRDSRPRERRGDNIGYISRSLRLRGARKNG